MKRWVPKAMQPVQRKIADGVLAEACTVTATNIARQKFVIGTN